MKKSQCSSLSKISESDMDHYRRNGIPNYILREEYKRKFGKGKSTLPKLYNEARMVYNWLVEHGFVDNPPALPAYPENADIEKIKDIRLWVSKNHAHGIGFGKLHNLIVLYPDIAKEMLAHRLICKL